MTDWIMKGENISKSFGTGDKEVKALNNVTIDIKRGSLTILKGSSGSGKTTLLNILGGLDQPTVGKVYFDDRELTSMKHKKREAFQLGKIGYIFQSVALISKLTAYENVDIALRIIGMKSKERHDKCVKYLSLVGLGQRLKHYAYELSGGEQQRVAIARSLAVGHDLILADEPTAELDVKTGLKVIKIFKNLIEQEGATIIMTTHDPDLLSIADCIYTLKDGVIIDE